ncbi:ATP synthase j chain-domain-containing protein [Xylariaceae sp. FL1019]|nr:ATP synthase j chain-domain-containing protein [Xylariaceae sp. FL1019]
MSRVSNLLWSVSGISPLKKFPAPVSTSITPDYPIRSSCTDSRPVKPMAPFFIAGAIIAYGINSAQNAMMACTFRYHQYETPISRY